MMRDSLFCDKLTRVHARMRVTNKREMRVSMRVYRNNDVWAALFHGKHITQLFQPGEQLSRVNAREDWVTKNRTRLQQR